MMIRQHCSFNDSLTISDAARLLNINRFGYYKWLQNNGPDPVLIRYEMEIKDEMQKIAVEFPRYGYRRMTIELYNRGFHANHKRVLRMMQEDNLLCARKHFKPLTTDSNHNHKVYPNLIRNLKITQPNQVWASDITYIQLIDEFVYLAVVLDLFTRKCIGWKLGRHIDTELTLTALDKALEQRWTPSLQGLIHHSDQGVQYASNQYVDLLKDHDFQISMSRKGNPYDNAFVESFIKTLKYEEVYLNEYETFSDALVNIGRFIDDVYNKKRLHSSLGYKSPDDFEREVNINILT
jgi:transposase InsO family protein